MAIGRRSDPPPGTHGVSALAAAHHGFSVAMASLKVFLCLLLVTLSKGAEEDQSGQYNPEIYEKPYETTEKEEEVTTEAAETEPTEVPELYEEPKEVPEVYEEPKEVPEVYEEPKEVPEVVDPAGNALDAPVAPSAPLAIPYPLLYSSQYAAPLVYSVPQYLRIAAGFPTVIV